MQLIKGKWLIQKYLQIKRQIIISTFWSPDYKPIECPSPKLIHKAALRTRYYSLIHKILFSLLLPCNRFKNMFCKRIIFYLFFITLDLLVAHAQPEPVSKIKTGAEQTEIYLPWIKSLNVALVVNQTSVIGQSHLVDSLIKLNVAVKKIFSPEHGFRGSAEAGAEVNNSVDSKSKSPVISLYGNHKKPLAEDIKGIDAVIFDLQDVGTRFYTYISTLQYVMESCAENNKLCIVLDRPNPNGFYIDGPVLDKKFKSFVGMQPIPVVHGLTVGEYAQMLNGEKWLDRGIQCNLKVVPVAEYDHSIQYSLPVIPSPNLPNMTAIWLYPSLCFFEGTEVSVARGTEFPFQAIGYPGFNEGNFSFVPKSIPGMAAHPPFENKECTGFDLREFGNVYIRNLKKIYLFWLISMYQSYPDKNSFFNDYFDTLAGTDLLRKQIIDGKTEEEIRKSWQDELNKFRTIRKKYLLYTDFE